MDDKEEGALTDQDSDPNELLESDSYQKEPHAAPRLGAKGLYNPVTRPEPSYRPVTSNVPSSEEDYSSDSDSDTPLAAKRKRTHTHMDVSYSRDSPQKNVVGGNAPPERPQIKAVRRNNIWANVMQEQVLAQEIGGFGINRKYMCDRSVESYDFSQARQMRGLPVYNSDEEVESEEMKERRLQRKRPVKERISRPTSANAEEMVRELPDIACEDDWTDEQLGHALSEALHEKKPELIVRVVTVLGRTKALELYKETQKLEQDGGLMTLDLRRRRTSGGVFLHILKSSPGVERSDINSIFQQDDKSSQLWRKRKRVHRRRKRHESNPQGEAIDEDGLHIGGLFSDDTGVKCPGSTPVTSPQPSDNEEDLTCSTEPVRIEARHISVSQVATLVQKSQDGSCSKTLEMAAADEMDTL
ncbi:phosphorylated adaptor for RNA export isoform X2 [Oratosquilla oratoria]|uniref:phosphorylated adaptor for RNA export isoform X2 n=1 Tax=Oratosquilla oratoria TaxID=337810 RepID=UPI003F75F644